MHAGWKCHKVFASLALLALLLAPAAFADAWLTVTPAGAPGLKEVVPESWPELRVADAGPDGFQVAVKLEGLVVKPQKSELGEFLSLTLPEGAVAGEIGTPGIPVLRRLFVALPGAEVSARVRTGPAYVADESALGMPVRLAPVQPPVEKRPGAGKSMPFEFDAAAYRANRDCAPQRVTLREVGKVREQRLFLLEIWPVSYNPGIGRLTYWTDLVVDVEMSGGTSGRSDVASAQGLERVVLNPSLVPERTGRGSNNYLIVVAEAYAVGITDFVNFKQSQGFNVITYTVPPGTTSTTIKNYIQSLWGGLGSPEYILIVGDTDTVPCWTGSGTGSPSTDLNYACVSGSDYLPDIAIGRFSVRSPEQLQNIVQKTIDLETGAWGDPEYAERACFMASVDNYLITEGTHNYVINTHLAPVGIECAKLYQVSYGATTQDVRNSFNGGVVYGVYSGHGGSTSWADGPPFSQTDVRNLYNVQMYPLVLSFACDTGDYKNYDECFTETWLREGGKGAAAIYGASVSSYWTEDDILEKRFFDVVYDDVNPIREVSPAWQASFLLYYAHFGDSSTTRRYMEMYNLMGDPSLRIPEPGGGADMPVQPGGNLQTEGVAGGPFVPDSQLYTLGNNTDAPLDYTVSTAATWVEIINGTGTIPVGDSAEVTVTLGVEAYTLGQGHYEAVVDFVNESTHDGDTTRMVILDVGRTIIDVGPPYGLQTGGPTGGPFTGSVTYTVTSLRPTPVTVEVAADAPWIAIDDSAAPASFVLSGTGATQDVVVSIDPAAELLDVGLYTGNVTFTNLTSGEGDTARSVLLEVGRVLYVPLDVPQPISDYTSTISHIQIADAYCVGDVDVEVDITHTFIGDLTVELTSPAGVTVRLHNRTGGSTNNLVTTYDEPDGTLPDGPGSLADFSYAGVTGTWTLTVHDHAGSDQGTLNSWALRIVPLGETCPPIADDIAVTIPEMQTADIALSGTSLHGLPLTYIITSLPAHGTLRDPAAGIIPTVPYALALEGHVVSFDPAGLYSGPDGFTYKVNDGQDSAIATVAITVGGPQPVHVFNLDTSPGWTTQGLWQFGVPTGQSGSAGGPDPTSGHTGSNVYGYNLNGGYSNNMPETYLITTPLDCVGVTDVELRFWKWLGIESSTWDHAHVAVSNNGTNWVTVWEHTGGSFTDTAWSQMVFDISEVADDQPTVYVRWCMGPTDGSVTYCGWNIDDIEIWGLVPFQGLRGDLNCDGLLNAFDIDPFVLALTDPAAYAAAYPNCDFILADINGDGLVNAFDIDPFVQLLTGGG